MDYCFNMEVTAITHYIQRGNSSIQNSLVCLVYSSSQFSFETLS